MLAEKTLAPDFILPDQNSVDHKLSDYRGQWVILYFYPKDDTPGCTTEACAFQDNLAGFATAMKRGPAVAGKSSEVKILGISADPVSSHRKFADKYKLNFTLLSDGKKEVIKKYEAEGIFTKRISYLIDPEGQIYKAYAQVKPDTHAEQVLADLPKL
ncbi:MAG TPA: peroxiredoxin [Candidatus Udaeobacter sp.]|nr:peroxiredoxin [Candidatus Udaeobacter sp.]